MAKTVKRYVGILLAISVFLLVVLYVMHHVSLWYLQGMDLQAARLTVQSMGIALNTILTIILVAGYIRMVEIQDNQETLMENELIAVIEENESTGSDEYGPSSQKVPYPQYNIELSNTGEGLARNLTVTYLISYDYGKTEVSLHPATHPLRRKEGRGVSTVGDGGGVLKPGSTEIFRAPVEFEFDDSNGDNPISIDTAIELLKSDDVEELYLGFKIEYESLSGEQGKLYAEGKRLDIKKYDGFAHMMDTAHSYQSSQISEADRLFKKMV